MDGTLDHVMMRVEDLDASLDWYGTHLDYVEHGRWEADTFTNVFLGPEDPHERGALLELTYNHDGRSYETGDAWGHISVRVPDVYDAYEELMAEGVEDYRDPESCGGRYAFVKDPDGHQLEISGREYGPKWSLDHVMMRVEDLDAAVGWFVNKLEYDEDRRHEQETFTNYKMRPREEPPEAMGVELTYNHDGRSYETGDAWGHFAVRADDLHDDWDLLMERGAEDYRDPKSCGNRYAFTKTRDGHEVELVER